MADAGAIRAGKAVVEASLNDAGLTAGLARSQARLRAFGDSLQAIGSRVFLAGAGFIGSLTIAARAFAEQGTHLAHQAEQVGASVEFIHGLTQGIEFLGGSAESATMSFVRFNSKLVQAAQGSLEAQREFAMLGLSWEQLDGKTLDDQLQLVSEGFQKIGNQAVRNRVAMQLFGRSGRELLQAMTTPGGFRGLIDDMKKLGNVMDEEGAAKALELHKAFYILDGAAGALMRQSIGPLIPFIKGLGDAMVIVRNTMKTWLNENKSLVTGLIVGSALVAGLGAGLFTLGIAFKVLGVALGGFTALFAPIKWLLTGVALLLNPFTLLIAAAIGIGAAFFLMTDTGRAALEKLKTDATVAAGFISDTFASIGQAIAGGDWTLAFEITCAGLKLAWLDFKNYVLGTIPGLRVAVSTIGDSWTAASRATRDTMTVIAGWFAGGSARARQQLLDDLHREDRGDDRIAPRDAAAQEAERVRLRLELRELQNRAANLPPVGGGVAGHGAPGSLLDSLTPSFNSRGTFSADAAIGLATAKNPVVEAIHEQTDRIIEQLQRIKQGVGGDERFA